MTGTRGREASGRTDETVAKTLGIVARFLGIDAGGRLGAKRVQQLRFELLDPEQETTTDMAIEDAVDALGERLRYRADNRYFVARSVRRAAGMTYRLSDEQVDELGGEATLEHVSASGLSPRSSSGRTPTPRGSVAHASVCCSSEW